MFEELGVKQPFVPESMVSQAVPVSESDRRTDSVRGQSWGTPQRQRQQQRKSQNLVRIQRESQTQPSPLVTAQKEFTKSTSMRVTPLQVPKRRSEYRQRLPIAPSTRTPSMKLVLYVLRLLILGVGIGVIVGTLFSILDPTSRMTSASSVIATVEKTQQKPENTAVAHQSGLKLSQEIMPLKTAVQQLAAKNAGLIPGIFFVDLDTGAYMQVNGASTFAAASMIKFPVLVAFFQDVDAGKIHLNEMLTLKQEMIGGGSGSMQYQPAGTKFSALETATKMITISDNTATNLLIARLGGTEALNQRFRSWGLNVTQIRNVLPDLPGTNTTSPKDLANLMALVEHGDLMSLRSHDRLLDIMRRTEIDTLLPRGLGQGAKIAHKTGDIGSLVGDVGLVDMPSGKRYIAVAMVKRPHNDSRAQELIRQVSRVVYQQFNQTKLSPVAKN